MTPTHEQLAIIEAATSSSDNLLISALAGSAKTTTLVLAAEAMKNQEICCLAFNKRIAEEMVSRLPSWCSTSTLSSAGYRAWSSLLSTRLTVDKSKTSRILKEWVRTNVQNKGEWFDYYHEDVLAAISFAKTFGYGPSPLQSLLTTEEFYESLDIKKIDAFHEDAIEHVLAESLAEGLRGVVDFDDMIYLPTLHPYATFLRSATYMVDEAQDLSLLNHRQLYKMSGKGRSRIIAVGDSAQSVYLFRGADESSMSRLASEFAPMRELSLTTCFRCPSAVIDEVSWRVPSIRAPSFAPTGQVTALDEWSLEDIPPSATILCRNNAPLFDLAIQFLLAGRKAELANGSLEHFARKVLSSLGSAEMTIDDANTALDLWEHREKEKRKDQDKLADRVACLRVFLRPPSTNLGQALEALSDVAKQKGGVRLLTGHKSKGLEWPDVYILDRELLNLKDVQDRNLLYVMQSRAQERLTYVNTADRTPHGSV